MRVGNPGKAFNLTLAARPDRGIFVRFFGSGKNSITRRYRLGDAAPAGLQCQFIFDVVRRGDGTRAVSTGGPLFFVNRSQI